MNNVNSLTLTISTIMFIVLTLLSYIFLYVKCKKIFNWKRNIVIILSGIALIISISFLANLSNNIDIVFACGIIFASPIIAYSLVSTKVFLDKNKNQKIIKIKEKNDK